MKKVILTALAVLSLTACGKETIREVLVTTPPTEAPAVEVNKYDAYLADLYDFSGQARSWSEDDLIKLATLICDSFDAGESLNGVIATLQPYSSGSYDDELFAGVITGAVNHICPEYKSYVQAQL